MIARARPRAKRRLTPWILQGFALIALVALVTLAVSNAAFNLRERGIASGFGFLDNRSGFAILLHLIDYSEDSTYLDVFWVGLLNTFLAAGIAILLSTLIGFTVGIARLSQNWLLAKLALAYVEAFRNIPLLVLIIGVYFLGLRPLPGPRQSLDAFGLIFLNNRGLYLPTLDVAPDAPLLIVVIALGLLVMLLLGWRARRLRVQTGHVPRAIQVGLGALGLLIFGALIWVLANAHLVPPELSGFNFRGGIAVIPELVALIVALSLFTAAFIAETVRAGLEAVARGQREAAAALGLHSGQSLWLVVMPQAVRVIAPPLASEYVNVVKNSSLAAAIAYPDLVQTFAGTALNQTGQAVEIIAITMAVYLAISLAVSLAMNAFARSYRWATR